MGTIIITTVSPIDVQVVACVNFWHRPPRVTDADYKWVRMAMKTGGETFKMFPL